MKGFDSKILLVACVALAACGDDGLSAGECVSLCEAGAPPLCEDNVTLVTFTSTGTCLDAACVFDEARETCAAGCVDVNGIAACAAETCDTVVCDAPPSPCHAEVGVCAAGVCTYPIAPGVACDDGDPCTTTDVCDDAAVCAGEALACGTPPAALCDGDTLKVSAATGTCTDGACSYPTTDTVCDSGCEEAGGTAACADDPCGFVTCDTPPLAVCSDADTLAVSAANGVCAAGVCDYATTTVTCARGCAAGAGDEDAQCATPAGLVIAEVVYDSDGSPDKEAFVELAGPAGTDLSDLELVGINGNGGAVYNRIALSGVIGASGRFVVAHPEASAATKNVADMLDTKVDYQNGPDSVQLRMGETIVDAVAYGVFGEGDIQGGEGTPATGTTVGQSLSRDRDDTDTNNNVDDFRAGTATPGAAASWPEAAPVVSLACPESGFADESLDFVASASAGVVTGWRFDFGDASAPLDQAGGSASHVFAVAGSYTVTATGTNASGQSDSATCTLAIAPAEEPFVYSGAQECFAVTGVDGYLYALVAEPPAVETDAHILFRFKGNKSGFATSYNIELESSAGTWQAVAVTTPMKFEWQTESFIIASATLQTAIANTGRLRFRWRELFATAQGCSQFSLTYNCSNCAQCPAGQSDLGRGCEPTDTPYVHLLADGSNFYCAQGRRELYFPGAPAPAGDAVLSVGSLGCGASTVRIEIYRTVGGWADVGTGQGGNCGSQMESYTIPQALLASAIGPDNRVRISWAIYDSCASGSGCVGTSDPCMNDAKLTYPRN